MILRREKVALVLLVARGMVHSQEIPEQFIAILETRAHLLDENSEYPPARGRKLIHYDYTNKRARIAVLTGFNQGKNYTRRYDQKQEYCTRGGEYPACWRSYLSESMPSPKLPPTLRQTDDTLVIDQAIYHRYIIDESIHERSLLYADRKNGFPRRLVNEMNSPETNKSFTPIMTYDFVQFDPVAPSEAVFELDAPWNHTSCSRHTGGWPYFHLFHHYLRI